MKTAIVTGANKNYFDHLLTLCKSLDKKKVINNSKNPNQVKLCIFNIDFTNYQISQLEKYCDNIITPKWDFKLKFKTEDWKMLLTVRPFLKDYFPGYENYIWLDADTVVLDSNFINSFSSCIENKDINIVSELDASYLNNQAQNSFKYFFNNFYIARGWVYKNNVKYLGKDYATKVLNKPIFNAGVYSIKKNSRVWDIWKKIYEKIIDSSSDDYCLNMDQASLNKAIYENFDLVNVFNAKFNWLVKNCVPVINKNFEMFTGSLPYEKISVVHLTQTDKKKKYKFYQLDDQIFLESTLEKIFEQN